MYPMDENGKCQAPHGYYMEAKFGVLSPMVRPIPGGGRTQLICVQLSGSYPYNIIDISYYVDIFNRSKMNCVNFIAYTVPVSNTIPLYLYKRGRNMYPTFTPSPPFGDGWEENELPAIYVFKPSDFPNGYLFYDDPGKVGCVPHPKGSSLIDCILISEENILRKPKKIEEMKEITSQEYYENEDKGKRSCAMNNLIVLLIIFVLVVGIIIVIKSD
jgi:hypothetical protein